MGSGAFQGLGRPTAEQGEGLQFSPEDLESARRVLKVLEGEADRCNGHMTVVWEELAASVRREVFTTEDA